MLQLIIYNIVCLCLISEKKTTHPTQHHHIRRSDWFFFICLPAALTMTHHHLHYSIPLLPTFFTLPLPKLQHRTNRSIIAFFSSIIVILFLNFIIVVPSHITLKMLQPSLSSLGSNSHPHRKLITTVYAPMKYCICSLSRITYHR